MNRHVNIPIFIPHLGCPNQCVFCNQKTISGVQSFDPESLVGIIDESLSTLEGDETVEIAFFGGSFTGIERAVMVRLLQIANTYVVSGRVAGIRCSTRPDYISEDILMILKKYGVTVIELGLQSTDSRVLVSTKRGHDFQAEKEACRLIVEHGFKLIGQMMIGLPLSDLRRELKTCEFIISSGACGARIYPTVVFYGTELCDMAQRGEYTPLSTDEAVARSAAVMRRFIESGIDVIRIGLCSSENLSSRDTYYAGPNHSALGELVINEVYYGLIRDEIVKAGIKHGESININVHIGSLSKAIGQKKKNKLRLCAEFNLSNIIFSESDMLDEYCISIER